jgi:isocitrate dehydrogenase
VVAAPEGAPAGQDCPAALTLRQFTEWARSDCKHVSERRDLLGQPFPASAEAGEEESFETFSMQAHMVFERIKVDHPVVELDGDEMTRIMWHQIRQKLIFPFLDMEIDYYDLSITMRDETEDQVTKDAIDAIQKHHVGIKCPTIMPDQARRMEFNLKPTLMEPNGLMQATLDGTMFHVPVVLKNIPRWVQGWNKPIIVGRPAKGNQAVELTAGADRPGTFRLVFEPADGDRVEETVKTFTHRDEGGVMMGACDTRQSIRDFAKGCFEYSLGQGMPLYLSTKNDVLEAYDGLFSDVFSEMYQSTYKKAFEDNGLWYQHRVIDDMVSQVIKSNGGFVLAFSSHHGDAMSRIVAQGFGSLGLVTSVLVCVDGQTVLAQPRHGTVTRHYWAHQRGERTSTNPIASIFAWTRGLAHRAKLDGNERLAQFSLAVEEACVNCVQGGQMSKDLALCVHGDQVAPDHWLATEDLLDAIANELRIVLGKGLRSETTAQAVPFEAPPASSEGDQGAAG